MLELVGAWCYLCGKQALLCFLKVSELSLVSLVERKASILLFCLQKAPASTHEGRIPPQQLYAGSLLERTVTGGNFIPGYLKTSDPFFS